MPQRKTKNRAGLCTSCSDKALPGSTRCRKCLDQQNAWFRRRYLDRKAAGICTACGLSPSISNEIHCSTCRSKQQEKQKNRAKVKAQNRALQDTRLIADRRRRCICIECECPELFRDDRCRVCFAREQVRSGKTFHEARGLAGLCRNCDTAIESETRCLACKGKHNSRRLKRKRKGLCARCGENNDRKGKTECSRCLKKITTIYAGRIKNGLCPHCGEQPPAMPGAKLCTQCLEISKQKNRRKHRRLRQQVVSAYGSKCACCGESRPEFIHVDHVDNDGAEHRRKIGTGGLKFYTWLRARGFPKKGFQLLCANCNSAKGIYGYCPHQVERGELTQERADSLTTACRLARLHAKRSKNREFAFA